MHTYLRTSQKKKISFHLLSWQYSYELLLQFLQKTQSTTILGVINEHINFQGICVWVYFWLCYQWTYIFPRYMCLSLLLSMLSMNIYIYFHGICVWVLLLTMYSIVSVFNDLCSLSCSFSRTAKLNSWWFWCRYTYWQQPRYSQSDK